MEEQVGQIWDKWIQRKSYQGYPEARVAFDDIHSTLAIYFRALGGDTGKKVVSAAALEKKSERSWLQKISGTGKRFELSWQDKEALRLPSFIDVFSDNRLNKKLYLWLAMLQTVPSQHQNWLVDCAQRTLIALENWPGFQKQYTQLVTKYIALRPDINHMKPEQKRLETMIRHTLQFPETPEYWPENATPPHPVMLWPDPEPPHMAASAQQPDPEDNAEDDKGKAAKNQQEDTKRRQARRVDNKDGRDGLMLFRFESIFSHAEFVNLNRGIDDDDNDDALRNVNDMDELAVTRADAGSGTLKLDLDLPMEEAARLSGIKGILIPEWDHRIQKLVKDNCRIIEEVPPMGTQTSLPDHLKKLTHQVKRQFAALQPQRTWLRQQTDGDEVDLEAWHQFQTELHSCNLVPEPLLYRQLRANHRDLSCLLLADLSLSTDAWVNNDKRVIDIIRDALYLFAESLSLIGDRFAISGFWSKRNDLVKYLNIKGFNEKHAAPIRQRISSLEPGYYTRMGAAIRYASKQLSEESTSQRLMLLLTDGKPNDLDIYEGRYGIEDTRHAIIEARKKGLIPFCITIDQKAEDYLPHIFGKNSFVVIQKAEELPKKLPALYARLTHLGQ